MSEFSEELGVSVTLLRTTEDPWIVSWSRRDADPTALFFSSPGCFGSFGSNVHHYHFQLCSDHIYFCFCLLIFPHASPSETTVKMKPFLFIFRVEPGGPPAQRRTSFCLFQMWCQVFTGSDPKNQFPGSASSRDARETPSAVSECVSYIDLFTWIWRICTFSSDLAVTWEFCPIDTLLCPSECMLYEWVTMNSLCIFTWRKKKNCPRILKSTLRPSPTVLSCNRVDVTLTSMYTKVLTEWDDTKRSTKCWQRNLPQNSPLPVLILFVYDLPSSRRFFSVSLWEGSELHTGLVRFQIFISLLMQTLHEVQSLETRCQVQTEAGSGTRKSVRRSVLLLVSTLGITQRYTF